MKKMRIIIGMFLALSITVMMGCVEEFEANITDMPTEGLVVEGDIISDSTVVFQLSKTVKFHQVWLKGHNCATL